MFSIWWKGPALRSARATARVTVRVAVVALLLAGCRRALDDISPVGSPTAVAQPTMADIATPGAAVDEPAAGEVTTGTSETAMDETAAGDTAADETAVDETGVDETEVGGVAAPADAESIIRALFIAGLAAPLGDGTAPGIQDAAVFPVAAPDGQPMTWVAHSIGLRDIVANQAHRVAVYQLQNDGTVAEVARLDLGGAMGGPGEEIWSSVETSRPAAPDYLGQGGVTQVPVEPSSVWLAVEGGVGAHGGAFTLIQFDGGRLEPRLAAFSVSPGVGQVRDLNGDGVGEAVIDGSDAYVFCYACGVREPRYSLWRLEGDQFVEVTARKLPIDAPEELIVANDELLRLSAADLWMDVARVLDGIAGREGEDGSGVLAWNTLLLRLNEEARRALLSAHSAFPLLDHVFYGDFTGALDLLREIPPDELFSDESPAIVGTVAEGWEESLALRLEQYTNAALKVQPENAAAWFLRGWADFLIGGVEQAAQHVAQAAALAPDDPYLAAATALWQARAGEGAPQLTALSDVELRAGPGASWPVVGDLTAGNVVTVSGVLDTDGDERWWQVVLPGDEPLRAWLRDGADVQISDAAKVVEVVAPTLVSPVAQRGRIFFSAPDGDKSTAIYAIDTVANATASLVIDDARAPALESSGDLLAFTSLRSDMLGLGGLNLRTGERLRFTYNVEDSLPRWGEDGQRLYFSSTREGDRKPRMYRTWANSDAETKTLGGGKDVDFQDGIQRIVYAGCDAEGAECGLWAAGADGSGALRVTDVASDARPRWSPSGDSVVFMSDARDGNWELYLLRMASGTVQRLTDSSGLDGLPAFSPNGDQVAFVSDRDGVWAIYTLPVPDAETGEVAEPAPLYRIGAELPDWLEQGLDWTP